MIKKKKKPHFQKVVQISNFFQNLGHSSGKLRKLGPCSIFFFIYSFLFDGKGGVKKSPFHFPFLKIKARSLFKFLPTCIFSYLFIYIDGIFFIFPRLWVL